MKLFFMPVFSSTASMKGSVLKASFCRSSMFPICCIAVCIVLFQQLAAESRKEHLGGRNAARSLADGLPLRQDWALEEDPDFCDALKRFPQPHTKKCESVKGNVTCDANKPKFFSQDGEDYYLFTRHFANLKRPGVYIDIAANDAIMISNTYYMDRCLKWRGICAEANSRYFEKLFRERSCLLVPTCISERDRSKVSFGMRGSTGGIVDTYKGDKATLAKSPVESLTCTTLDKAMKKAGVTEVDYMSLDVEGHELLVLKGIDWDNVRINIITPELSAPNRVEVTDFLVSKGYRALRSADEEINGFKGFHMNDPIFIHESQVFGRPT